MTQLSWGHININVTNLEASIAFYTLLGFKELLPGIPYLNLEKENFQVINSESAVALDMPSETRGRACILELDSGFPKLDLTEWTETNSDTADPLLNQDTGLVRICLASRNVAADYAELSEAGVKFLSEPQTTQDGKADIALCVDPDGTLIEIIELHLEKWT